MNLLIHIEINEINLLHYQKRIVDWSAEHISNITTVDFDNHSDSFLTNAAIKLAKEAEKVGIIIDVEASEVNLGGIIKFLNAMLRLKKDHVMIIVNGDHKMIKKMVVAFNLIYDDLDFERQKETLINFYST